MYVYVHVSVSAYITYIHAYIHYITLRHVTSRYVSVHYITLGYVTLHTYIHYNICNVKIHIRMYTYSTCTASGHYIFHVMH